MLFLYPIIRRPPLRQSELGQWIAKHMPELDAELGPMTHDRVRQRLNEITGLGVKGSDPIRGTLPLYLAKLKEMSQAEHYSARLRPCDVENSERQDTP